MSDPASLAPGLGIPTLRDVLNPSVLSSHLEPLKQFGSAGNTRVEVLSVHYGSRCTLSIGIETKSCVTTVIGKVYASDRSDVFEAMQRIWAAGFDSKSLFSIPEPLAYLRPLNLLLLQKAIGPTAHDLLLEGSSPAARLVARRCALWLAAFHRRVPAAGTAFDCSGHFEAMSRWVKRIARVSEHLGKKALRLFTILAERAPGLAPAELRAGHGSFNPGQITLEPGGRTITFDWDGYDAADPARDVARFTVALRRLALGRLRSIRALDGPAGAFLDGYREGRGPGVKRNLPFYEAAICLQLAKYNIAHPVAHWREKLEAMLDEGLRIAEGTCN